MTWSIFGGYPRQLSIIGQTTVSEGIMSFEQELGALSYALRAQVGPLVGSPEFVMASDRDSLSQRRAEN